MNPPLCYVNQIFYAFFTGKTTLLKSIKNGEINTKSTFQRIRLPAALRKLTWRFMHAGS